MQIKVDDAGLIQAYAAVGSIDSGQDYDGVVPDDLAINFKPGWYKLDNGVIAVNSDYQGPTIEQMGPTTQDLLNANMLKQVAANTVATAAIMKQLAAQVKEA